MKLKPNHMHDRTKMVDPIKESEYILARALNAMFNAPGSDEHKEAMTAYLEHRRKE